MTNPTDEAKQAAEADPIDKLISTIEANYYLCDTAKEARRAYTAIRTKLEEAEKERDNVTAQYKHCHALYSERIERTDKLGRMVEQLRADLAKVTAENVRVETINAEQALEIVQLKQQRDELAGKVERAKQLFLTGLFSQSLPDYLHYQFPATRRHIPLNDWMDGMFDLLVHHGSAIPPAQPKSAGEGQ